MLPEPKPEDEDRRKEIAMTPDMKERLREQKRTFVERININRRGVVEMYREDGQLTIVIRGYSI